MINTHDGSIGFEYPNVRLVRGMTLQQFRESSAFPTFKLSQDLDPCYTYRCELVKANNRTFDITVRFYSGLITGLWLTIVEPPRPAGKDYYHREYLRDTLGFRPEGAYGSVEYSFAWGTIFAGEYKCCETSIGISYAN